MKQTNTALTITKRELLSYFTSPIAYIVTGLFALSSGILFFSMFFLADRAELRAFFGNLPVLLSFFVPALTMRMFAEESKSGSIETLLTLPVRTVDVVLGKFLAAFVSGAVLLIPSVFYVITCCIFGSPDAGPIIGGYIGSLFLIASFCAIGLFATSMTKNQIIAFFASFAICIFLTMIGQFAIFMPANLTRFITYLCAFDHFESISRGIIDSRDLVYFVSVTALFFVLTVKSVRQK